MQFNYSFWIYLPLRTAFFIILNMPSSCGLIFFSIGIRKTGFPNVKTRPVKKTFANDSVFVRNVLIARSWHFVFGVLFMNKQKERANKYCVFILNTFFGLVVKIAYFSLRHKKILNTMYQGASLYIVRQGSLVLIFLCCRFIFFIYFITCAYSYS